jgi:hypothetical protein
VGRLFGILRYRFNRLLSRGTGGQYLLLAVFAALIVVFGLTAGLVGLFSQGALEAEGIADDIDGGVLDSAWWSLKHVIDPGAFAEDYGAPWPVLAISLLLSITGLGILGVLIAFITSSVQRGLEVARKGNLPVVEEGHILLLGWSQKVAAILDFLHRSGGRRTVVLLSTREIGAVQDALKLHLTPWPNLDIVLRAGATNSLAELERVGLATAGSVILVAGETESSGAGESDIETIKTLMLISGYDGWADGRPTIVGEITQKRNVEIANIAASRRLPLVSTSEIVSKIIVQAARQPGISSVYGEIFSFEGNTVFVRECPGAAGHDFADVAHWYADAIPIGIAWQEGNRMAAALNPEPDYEIAEDEKLILLSAGDRVDFDASRVTPDWVFSGDEVKETPRLDRLLILGWNDNIDEILSELDAHMAGDAVATVLAAFDEEAARDILDASLPQDLKNLRLDYRQGSSINRRTLESLSPASYDVIITLADHSHGEDDPDARTIMSLLLLTDIARSVEMPHVVAEIYDGSNAPLVDTTLAGDVIVTPEMVSLQLAQISRHPVLGSIYYELLSAGGIECRLQPLSRYASPGRPVSFAELTVAAQRFNEVALGVRRNTAKKDEHAPGLYLNPAKDSRWVLEEKDSVVVLAQQLYE